MSELEHPLVSDAFDLLARSTELSLGEYTSITQSQADIERYLMQHLGTFSTVLFGAFSRKTIVSPLPGSIVDMLVIYRGADVKNIYPSRIFSKLKAALREGYSDSYVLENRSVLMLPMNNFFYKIQPAYALSGHTYMLPDEKFDDWTRYDITSYNDIFVKENVRHKGRLIEVIRMIKTWNRVSGNFFNGYYLELLITDLLSSHDIISYSETLRYIFKSAVAKVVFQQHDPANLEFQVEGLNDIDDLIKAMKLLKKSYRIADEAVIFEKEGNTVKAMDNWNRLFPMVFPTQVDLLVGKARKAGIRGVDALRMLVDQQR